MKIPSLFTKAPKYRQFSYTPRYYDPKKEEHEERVRRIKEELDAENGVKPEIGEYDYRARMSGAFQAARRRAKPQSELNVAVLRLSILLFISLLLFGMFIWGPKVFYSLFLIFPVWIYLRFFKKNNRGGE